ncbi:phage tail protein [Anabaena catenula]|uniref:Tip attachment protein J domain-containing protein n=1 Tax=Anabaena catenula FACHB-362 TaxID=2692877 RepID=A0ABR8J9D0_9NOST|nr:phage tail protein [Anabaena catenula]MBD2694439.1 hypothetical protein [Anabaena catenula FACHB-362]
MATVALNLAIGFTTNYLLGLLAPTQKVEGSRLSDLSAPKSSYGAAIPKVYGSSRLAGNLMWSTPITERVSKTRSGGKGGGGGVQTTNYAYSCNFAFLLCSGEITGVRKIWLNSKLVYNVSPEADVDTIAASLKFAEKVRFYNGSATQGQDSLMTSFQGVDDTPAYRGRAYILFDDYPLEDFGNRLPAVSCEVVTSGYWSEGRLYNTDISLGSVVKDLCLRVGFSESEVDVTEIDSILVKGFVVSQSLNARDAIAQLQRAYFFDALESNGKLKFINQVRGGSPITIPRNDLASAEEGQERPDLFKETRQQDIELPDEVTVTYVDYDFSYQQNTQTTQRQNSPNKNKLEIRLDLVLTASQALTIARKTIFLEWLKRRKFEFSLPLRYSVVEPGDVVQVNLHSSTQQNIYLSKVDVGANFLLQCEGVPYDPTLLTLTAVATAPAVSLSLGNPSDTELRILDLPLLKDTDEPQGVYVAATGNSAWRNAQLFVSRNNGSSYDSATTIITRTVLGTCATTLETASEFYVDYKNTLRVTVDGELESVSEFDFLNGRNIALVGSEVIYFKDAVLVSGNTYDLSTLLRGRRGTEQSIGTHTSGEDFYLLSGYLTRVKGEPLDLNTQRLYKAPINGQALADITPTAFTSTGRSLKPYAPCHVKGSRDASGNLTISWVRRNRLFGELLDYQDVPLSETSESYEVVIFSAPGVVLRTFNTTSPTVVYNAADQTTDFGSLPGSVEVAVAQFSSSVGLGYASLVEL